MIYQLVAFLDRTIAEAEDLDSLDFSRLRGYSHWSVWIDEQLKAVVDWSPNAKYVLFNEASDDKFYIPHSMIIPSIKIAIAYNVMFRQSGFCRVYPGILA